MKRYGNLYQKIISPANLEAAENKARKGKLKQSGVIAFDKNKQVFLTQLHQSLSEKRYKTSSYTVFKIYEPKEREVFRLPYFPDRIVHHAIMNVLKPIFVSTFTAFTYSCIEGRGVHSASKALEKALKNPHLKFCLKIDIKKFYPSVDNNILKRLLRRKIKDNDLLWLLDEIIDSSKGLPIGNYLSQYFGNFYLTYFDHWLKENKGVVRCFRYCDDVVILSETKEFLHALLFDIKQYLKTHLNLEVKSNHRIFPVTEGIDAFGYVHFPTHKLLRKSIKQNFARAVKRGKCLSVVSYYGWAKHCNSKNLLKKLLMKDFSDFGIKPTTDNYVGDRIELKRLLDRPVIIHKFKITKSKFPDKGDCLYLQLELDNEKRVLFTSAGELIKMIKEVPEFPFRAKITKQDDRVIFVSANAN